MVIRMVKTPINQGLVGIVAHPGSVIIGGRTKGTTFPPFA